MMVMEMLQLENTTTDIDIFNFLCYLKFILYL